MAKQKSGLGRGLNALFNEADTNQKEKTQVTTGVSNTPQKASSTDTKYTDSHPMSDKTAHDRAEELVNTHTSAKKDQKSSASIYFSEDALENAKVVEREARKVPTLQSASEPQKKPATISASKPTEPVEKSVPKSVYSKEKQEESKKHQHTETKHEKGTVGEVELSKVHPNPEQPRTNFKPEEIEELASSIKKEGLLQPILVNKVGDHYQIIAGERRWQACKTLNMKTIPVRFWTADNDKALELALIENIQRSDLNPIEEAYGYKRLMERKGMTQSEVAQAVSKGRSTIANALRLLDLPEEAQQLLFEEKISAGHARAILSIPTPEGRKTLTNKLIHEKLSVRETESIARLLSGRDKSKEEGTLKRVPTPASFKKAAKSLSKFLLVPVRVKTVQGKNKIEIQFKDEEELERILNVINEAK